MKPRIRRSRMRWASGAPLGDGLVPGRGLDYGCHQVQACNSQETIVRSDKRHASYSLARSARGGGGHGLLEHPDPCQRPSLRIVHRIYAPDGGRDRPGRHGPARPDRLAFNGEAAPGTRDASPHRSEPSAVEQELRGGWRRRFSGGHDSEAASDHAARRLPRRGPALGAGVVRWRVGPAPHRRPVHGAAARPSGGRRPDPALGRTGDLMPAPAAGATTELP
jgi:hypothetical protein